MIEKWFDGLDEIYGESTAKKLAKLFKKEIEENRSIPKLVKAGLNDAGEALESIATDLANKLLESVYNEKSVRQNWDETEWGRVGKNMLINTIVAILLGDKVWKTKD